MQACCDPFNLHEASVCPVGIARFIIRPFGVRGRRRAPRPLLGLLCTNAVPGHCLALESRDHLGVR